MTRRENEEMSSPLHIFERELITREPLGHHLDVFVGTEQ